MDKIIGLDWLQVSGTVRSIEGFFGNNTVLEKEIDGVFFNFERKSSSADFENIFNVSFVDENGVVVDFGVLATGWRLRKDVNFQTFKVYNEILYTYRYRYIVHLINLFFVVQKISRIDFYCDFLKFDEVGCEDFIGLVARGDFDTNHGNLKKSICMKGLSYESLTVGSRNSTCRYYLYNKTKELEKVGKDYISILHNSVFGDNKEVWRVEFSFLRPDNVLLDWFEEYENEEERFLCLSDFFNVGEICDGFSSFENLFVSIFKRYFVFKDVKYKKIIYDDFYFDFLFSCVPAPVKMKKRNNTGKKTQKMFLKCLDSLNTELRAVNFRKRNFSEIIDYFIDTRNLHKYARENCLYPRKTTLSKTCVKNE